MCGHLLHHRRMASKRNFSFLRATLAGLALGCSVQAIPANAPLPQLGDASAMGLGDERKLGDRIVRELYRDPDYLDDPVIMEYVQGIWQPLLGAARLRGELSPEVDAAFAWEILLGRDRSVNAFALPGGYLGLYMGLVSVVSSRDELASVLAHELTHVTQRHISRNMERQSAQTPWLIGAMILGILAASKSADGANAMIIGGQAASAQAQLNFSRDMEREADRIGFGLMAQAGFAPRGFVTMFDKLQQASRLNDSGGFPYLRSHPLSTERMSDMQTRLNEWTTEKPQTLAATTDMVHAMVAARARVLANARVDDLRVWSSVVEEAALARLSPAQRAGVLYGATLAASLQRDFARTEPLMARLQQVVIDHAPGQRMARLLGAEIALEWRKHAPDQALSHNAKALELLAVQSQADSRAELLLRTQALLGVGKGAQAREELQVWVALHPRDASAWQMLATVHAASGNTLSAVRAEAEGSLAQLDYAAAWARLRAAQEIARKGGAITDHIEASIVDTRARMVEAVLKEQALQR